MTAFIRSCHMCRVRHGCEVNDKSFIDKLALVSDEFSSSAFKAVQNKDEKSFCSFIFYCRMNLNVFSLGWICTVVLYLYFELLKITV